jgi:hypothetical protein
MSVTSLRAYQNSGSDKPRYGLPDAPLDSCPLVFARCSTYEDRDPLTFCVLSNWNDYLLVVPPDEPGTAAGRASPTGEPIRECTRRYPGYTPVCSIFVVPY